MNKYGLMVGLLLAAPVMAETIEASEMKTFGDKNQNVVYVFTSPSCPHCATYHKKVLPALTKKIADEGLAQVKLVDMAVDRGALKVAQLGRCMDKVQHKKYMDLVYQNQGEWAYAPDSDGKIKGYAQKAGLNKLSINRCWDNMDLGKTINKQWQDLSKKYRVTGMPTTVLVKGIIHKTYVGADEDIVSEIKKELKQ